MRSSLKEVLEIVRKFYETVNMPLKIRLSFRDPKTPEKYLGDPTLWEKAQSIISSKAEKAGLEFFTAEGEAAFYGPKIDFIATDSIHREWQVATAQLDFVQPARFKITYTDKQGKEQTPIMVHFAVAGSLERFLSVYIEHTAGNFPLWLAPVQVKVIPVRENHNTYAEEVYNLLKENNIRAELDSSDSNLGGKVRNAKNNKIPYWIVIGDKEIEANKITLESRDNGQLGQVSKEELVSNLLEEIKNKI